MQQKGQGAQGSPQVLPSGPGGALWWGMSHSLWRMEARTGQEMLRSWDTSCLRSCVSLGLLLTAWGILHVVFQPVLKSGYILLVMYFFNVAATQFYLTGKNVFALLPH